MFTTTCCSLTFMFSVFCQYCNALIYLERIETSLEMKMSARPVFLGQRRTSPTKSCIVSKVFRVKLCIIDLISLSIFSRRKLVRRSFGRRTRGGRELTASVFTLGRWYFPCARICHLHRRLLLVILAQKAKSLQVVVH